MNREVVKKIFLLIVLLQCSLFAVAQPVLGARNKSSGNTASLSIGGFTVAGTNRFLVVTASGSQTIGTATYGAQTMTVEKSLTSGTEHTTVYSLIAPAVGTAAVTIGFASKNKCSAVVTLYTNVDQTTPFRTSPSAAGSFSTGSTSPASVTIVSNASDLVVASIGTLTNAPTESGAGQTNIDQDAFGGGNCFSNLSGHAGAASVTMSYTFTNDDYGIMAGSIRAPIVAPIELIGFSANFVTDKVVLDWTTATELNNDYFTIEKSVDGFNFDVLTTVPGAGNSSVQHSYSTVDNNPAKGVSYYRLKQTDYDGHFEYFDAVAVDNENAGYTGFSFNIFPNPNEGTSIHMSINAAKKEEILVVVYDISGRESYSKIIVIEDAGNSVYGLDPSNKLSPGIYFVSATSNQKTFNSKLIVK
jgi:hypothetical protein